MQALNLNVEDLGARPCYPGAFVLDHGEQSIPSHYARTSNANDNRIFILGYEDPSMTDISNSFLCVLTDALVSRSNAMQASQKREHNANANAAAAHSPPLAVACEVNLPPEWTY